MSLTAGGISWPRNYGPCIFGLIDSKLKSQINFEFHVDRYYTYDLFDIRLALGHFFGPKYSRVSGVTCNLATGFAPLFPSLDIVVGFQAKLFKKPCSNALLVAAKIL